MGVEAEGMPLAEVLAVIDALTGSSVPFWITGGWGVDVLVGSQTRPHRDLDLDIDATHEQPTLDILAELGYSLETDGRPTRAEFSGHRGWVDIHPIRFDDDGDARQAAPDGTFWHWPSRYFTTREFAGRTVGCYTVEAQRFFHLGYDTRDHDVADLAQLDRLERVTPRSP